MCEKDKQAQYIDKLNLLKLENQQIKLQHLLQNGVTTYLRSEKFKSSIANLSSELEEYNSHHQTQVNLQENYPSEAAIHDIQNRRVNLGIQIDAMKIKLEEGNIRLDGIIAMIQHQQRCIDNEYKSIRAIKNQIESLANANEFQIEETEISHYLQRILGDNFQNEEGEAAWKIKLNESKQSLLGYLSSTLYSLHQQRNTLQPQIKQQWIKVHKLIQQKEQKEERRIRERPIQMDDITDDNIEEKFIYWTDKCNALESKLSERTKEFALLQTNMHAIVEESINDKLNQMRVNHRRQALKYKQTLFKLAQIQLLDLTPQLRSQIEAILKEANELELNQI